NGRKVKEEPVATILIFFQNYSFCARKTQKLFMPQRILKVCSILFCVSAGGLTYEVVGQEKTTTPLKPGILPPMIVSATNMPAHELLEAQPIGPNQQPEWTTRRRFSTTRIYVLPPWQFEF